MKSDNTAGAEPPLCKRCVLRLLFDRQFHLEVRTYVQRQVAEFLFHVDHVVVVNVGPTVAGLHAFLGGDALVAAARALHQTQRVDVVAAEPWNHQTGLIVNLITVIIDQDETHIAEIEVFKACDQLIGEGVTRCVRYAVLSQRNVIAVGACAVVELWITEDDQTSVKATSAAQLFIQATAYQVELCDDV